MKKITLIIIALSLALSSYSQKEQKELSSYKISTPYISASHTQIEDRDYVYIGFQNIEYSSITDIHSIMLTKQVDLNQFADDLKDAISRAKLKKTVYWDKNKEYKIYVYDFTNSIYISDTESISGHTALSVKKAQKLLDWITTIKLQE